MMSWRCGLGGGEREGGTKKGEGGGRDGRGEEDRHGRGE